MLIMAISRINGACTIGAILKSGMTKFGFEVIEYCAQERTVLRENKSLKNKKNRRPKPTVFSVVELEQYAYANRAFNFV